VNRLTDQQLLREYAGRQWEAAFAELVRRHVDFVHSAARRMVCDAHLAEDVTQSVFAALAQNARQLAGHPVLSGWLHRTAQNLAANVVRSEVRRRAREQEAAAMNELLAAAAEPRWEQIAPHLDAALGELSEADRDAVLLRYFEKKSAGEMAQILGVSADAAQKRVSRAVERLREFFSKRNVTIGASGLTVLISANAVQAAPAGLALTICTATLAGTAVSTATVIAATKTIAMTTLQKTVITAALAVAAGAGIFEAHQAAQLRGQNQTLQQQQTPLAEQIRQLQRERDDATNRLAGMAEEIAKDQKNNLELLRLRAEVTQLKSSASEAKAKQKQGEPDGYLAMAQIQFSGYNTPQAAYKSFRWALVNSNYDDWNASMSPQDRNEPDNTGAFRGYVASNKALTDFQILGEKKLGDDRVGLKVREDDDGGNTTIVVWPILRVGDQWKIHLNPQGYYRGWEQDTNEGSRQSVPKAWILPEQPKNQ
jgi:RNA polymerase sigma factor (sigma-70 family)